MVCASLLSQTTLLPSPLASKSPRASLPRNIARLSRSSGTAFSSSNARQTLISHSPKADDAITTTTDHHRISAAETTQDPIVGTNLPLLALTSSPLLLASLLTCPPASAGVIFSLAEDLEPLGYSQASYYTSLALFIISIPGLWSLIKRATKSKIVRRTFEVPGPAVVAQTGGKSMAQLAGEITSLLQRSNYKVKEAKEVVTFEGDISPNRGQAAFLVFCTALSLASVALVLSITNPDIGDWWYSMTLLSPLAGVYYWRKAARKEEIQVKIVISDDERTADIIMQGDDEEIERVRRELNVMEKGLEYVKGIFES